MNRWDWATLFLLIAAYLCARHWRRRRFQMHLSTLLLIAIFAGGIMWLNAKPIQHGTLIGWPIAVNPNEDCWRDDEENDRSERYFGWPFLAIKPAFWHMNECRQIEEILIYPRMLANALWAFVMLSALAFAIEWRIKRGQNNDKSQMTNQQ